MTTYDYLFFPPPRSAPNPPHTLSLPRVLSRGVRTPNRTSELSMQGGWGLGAMGSRSKPQVC